VRVVPVLLAMVGLGAGCGSQPVKFANLDPFLPVTERESELLSECKTKPQACAELGERKLEWGRGTAGAPLAAAYMAEACIRGSARGCADLAVLRAEGRGVARDEARALLLARGACEAGAGNGCVTWARLLSKGESVAPDGGPRAAMERGCTLGQPEACAVLGRLADGDGSRDQGLVLKAGSAVTAMPAAIEGAADQGDLELTRKELGAGAWAETCAEAYLEPNERGALGLGRQQLAGAQPTVNDLRLARPLGEVIGRAVAKCACPPAIGIKVALRLGQDGRAFEVRSNRPEAEACVGEQIAALDLPAPRRASGLLWWEFDDFSSRLPWKATKVDGPEDPDRYEKEWFQVAMERGCPVVPPVPRKPSTGELPKYVKPREVTKGCAGQAIGEVLRSRGVAALGNATVKFAVGKGGQVTRVGFLDPPNQRCDVVLMLKRAIQSCAFEPGRDSHGQPQMIWVIMPLRFEAN
jgi:hypothetical protein